MTETFPIETVPPAVLPLLIEARQLLHRLAAPQACRLEDAIGAALEQLIHVAEDVESYGNKWCGGKMGELADKIREATRDWWEN